MDRQFTKIKYDRKKKIIEFRYIERSLKDQKSEKEVVFKGYEEPLPSFLQTLDSLIGIALEICSFPLGYETGMTVRSVTITWVDGIMGAVITVLKDLENSNAPLVINTPHLPTEPYNENDEISPTLPLGCKQKIEDLCDEAEMYMKGERAETQTTMRLVS